MADKVITIPEPQITALRRVSIFLENGLPVSLETATVVDEKLEPVSVPFKQLSDEVQIHVNQLLADMFARTKEELDFEVKREPRIIEEIKPVEEEPVKAETVVAPIK